MAEIDKIADVKIGAAASFRQTLNENFNTIKEEWKGVYVGPESEVEVALAKLKEGGIWIVTSEEA